MTFKALVPSFLRSAYHFSVAILGAGIYGVPSRRIRVIAVTGTKGKTSTTEMIAAIFRASGEKTALINSIHESIADDERPNPIGRSMPGRARLQKFLRRAVNASCTTAIIEMTSEGAAQHRHRGIALDALVFLNLAPEHIESHGSVEAYSDAKFSLGLALAKSPKRPRTIVANQDDAQSSRYLSLPVEKKLGFSLSRHEPRPSPNGGTFVFEGRLINTPQPGEFSLQNALAAATIARAFGVSIEAIATGLSNVTHIEGRAERVDAGQDFTVIVDYAHTPESLAALCDAYRGQRRICILGAAGGGRDTWKRPVMGKTAEDHAEVVILTTDDPYDDDPARIAREIAAGMSQTPEIILDRREAIRRAFSLAEPGDVVLITGKGTDPIYGKGGNKIKWNDVDVAKEELASVVR